MGSYKSIRDFDLAEKRVFVRVDFNVPLLNGENGKEVGDTTRIQGALETIRYITERGGKCILASHLGRPKGTRNPDYSLEPVAAKLSEMLEQEVILTDAPVGDGARSLSFQLKGGQVMLLENLRFDPGEEANSPDFVAHLAELCDIYVSDAFGALHRAHASTVGLPKITPEKCIGLLVERELEYLEPLRTKPETPMGIIMGGAKVSDKLGVLSHFMDKVDRVFIGGAMAYAFLKAKEISIGKSLCADEQVNLARKILRSADSRGIKVLLPVDHVTALKFNDADSKEITDGPHIPEDRMGMDIGPKTVEVFAESFSTLKTIFWNGPMGVFENRAFAGGTFGLARAIANCSAKKLAGGGDVAAALEASGVADQFDFISTGGGATLEYLEGKVLPGLKVMERSKQEIESASIRAEEELANAADPNYEGDFH